MGVFSWECSHCKESIKNVYSQYSNGIVLVTNNKIFVDKKYDGYGRINNLDIFILSELQGNIKEYHEAIKLELETPRNKAIDTYYNEEREEKNQIKCLHISCFEQILTRQPNITAKELYDILDISVMAEDQGHDWEF